MLASEKKGPTLLLSLLYWFSLILFVYRSSIAGNVMSYHTVTLFDGGKMPTVGLGTWKSKPGQVEAAVKTALEAGYRHIDGAHVYGNEKEIGTALKEKFSTGFKREDLFIVSKLWNNKHRPADVRPALLNTLQDLQLEYIDLYLIHWPLSFVPGDDKFPKNPDGSLRYDDVPPIETWTAMEKLVDEGLVKYIGLSNFNSQQIDEIMSKCRIQPAVLQCEAHPYLNQHRLIDHITKHKIIFTAYSPLGSPDRPWARPDEPVLMENPTLLSMAQKYNKSVAQILIRFQVERGVTVIPKSVTPERIKSNFDIFDFKISDDDMKTLVDLDINWRACIPMIEEDGKLVARDRAHPYFPFNIPY